MKIAEPLPIDVWKESILSLIQSPGSSCLFAGNTEEHIETHHNDIIRKIQTGKLNRSKGPDFSKDKLKGIDRDGERTNSLKEIQDLNF